MGTRSARDIEPGHGSRYLCLAGVPLTRPHKADRCQLAGGVCSVRCGLCRAQKLQAQVPGGTCLCPCRLSRCGSENRDYWPRTAPLTPARRKPHLPALCLRPLTAPRVQMRRREGNVRTGCRSVPEAGLTRRTALAVSITPLREPTNGPLVTPQLAHRFGG